METIITSREECEKKAANIISSKIASLLKTQNKVILGIPGGRSVENIFHKLLEETVDWKHVHIFMIDERCVTLNSVESNYRLAYNAFIKNLVETKKLPQENAHPFEYNQDNVVGSLRRYIEQFTRQGGKFDIILLSAGEDGHVAALYPKHRSITTESSTFFYINDSPKPPKHRMTAARKLLQASKTSILLFFGPSKQQAFEKFQKSSVIECPAKLITSTEDSYVLVSKEI